MIIYAQPGFCLMKIEDEAAVSQTFCAVGTQAWSAGGGKPGCKA